MENPMVDTAVENITKAALLDVRGLSVHFDVKGHGMLRAVDGVDFDIRKGEILGLVGESGCGKTVFSLSL